MIIKRPENCRCCDPTYTCKIYCTCAGPDPDHAEGCHYHLWRDAPGFVESINTGTHDPIVEDMASLNVLRDHCHQTSLASGWYRNSEGINLSVQQPLTTRELEYVQGVACTKFALIHSEISEALEGYRKGINDAHLLDLPAVDVELADALIRIFDLAGYLGCDLATAVERKMAYNATRKDHTKEAREAPGGKKF